LVEELNSLLGDFKDERRLTFASAKRGTALLGKVAIPVEVAVHEQGVRLIFQVQSEPKVSVPWESVASVRRIRLGSEEYKELLLHGGPHKRLILPRKSAYDEMVPASVGST
jgi:hypothetical protein